MTITIEISPEVEAELSRQAASNGTVVAVYAANLLQDAAHLPGPALHPQPKKTLREVFESVRGLADDVDFNRNPSTGRHVDLS
jgi:hypothetical protein